MHLTGLFLYPVKSLRGCAVEGAEIDLLGIVGDRRFLVVEESGRFLTQRTVPRMAQVSTALVGDQLVLSAKGAGSVHVSRLSDPSAPLRTVSVWKSEGLQAEDCGDGVAAWLSDFLQVKCRLVRAGHAFNRPSLKSAARPGDLIAFSDAVPFLIVSEASLADLNDRLAAQGEEALPMDRFRPNLVVTGCAAYAEDTWPRLRIGSMIFRPAGPCARCPITTTDQLTGERAKEPLRTLATYRRNPKEPTNVDFGQNLIHETKSGRVRVGDPVEVLA
jgi:uncharacterized protein YcbX